MAGHIEEREALREIGVLLGDGVPWAALDSFTINELDHVMRGWHAARSQG